MSFGMRTVFIVEVFIIVSPLRSNGLLTSPTRFHPSARSCQKTVRAAILPCRISSRSLFDRCNC